MLLAGSADACQAQHNTLDGTAVSQVDLTQGPDSGMHIFSTCDGQAGLVQELGVQQLLVSQQHASQQLASACKHSAASLGQFDAFSGSACREQQSVVARDTSQQALCSDAGRKSDVSEASRAFEQMSDIGLGCMMTTMQQVQILSQPHLASQQQTSQSIGAASKEAVTGLQGALSGCKGLAGNASLDNQFAVARDTSWLALCSGVGSRSVCEFARVFDQMSFGDREFYTTIMELVKRDRQRYLHSQQQATQSTLTATGPGQQGVPAGLDTMENTSADSCMSTGTLNCPQLSAAARGLTNSRGERLAEHQGAQMEDQRLRPSKRKASELSAQAQGDAARHGHEAQYAQHICFSNPVSAMPDTSNEPSSDVSHFHADFDVPDDDQIYGPNPYLNALLQDPPKVDTPSANLMPEWAAFSAQFSCHDALDPCRAVSHQAGGSNALVASVFREHLPGPPEHIGCVIKTNVPALHQQTKEQLLATAKRVVEDAQYQRAQATKLTLQSGNLLETWTPEEGHVSAVSEQIPVVIGAFQYQGTLCFNLKHAAVNSQLNLFVSGSEHVHHLPVGAQYSKSSQVPDEMWCCFQTSQHVDAVELCNGDWASGTLLVQHMRSRAELAVALRQRPYLSLLVQAWSSNVNDDLRHTSCPDDDEVTSRFRPLCHDCDVAMSDRGETCGRLPKKGPSADMTAEASTDPPSCVQQVLKQYVQGVGGSGSHASCLGITVVQAADSAEADCAVAARCKDMADGKKALSGLDCRGAADCTDVAFTKKSVGGAYAGACRSDSKPEMVVYFTTHGYAQDAAPQNPPCVHCELDMVCRIQSEHGMPWDLDAYANYQLPDSWHERCVWQRLGRHMDALYSQAANLQALLQAQGSKQICYLSAYSLGRACVCHVLEVLKGWSHRQRSWHQLTHCPYHASKISDSEQDPQCKLHKQI